MYKAGVALTVSGGLSLDGLDELIEKVRETAYPLPGGRTILVYWEAPTMWALQVAVRATLDEVESNYFGYVSIPSIEEPGDGTDTNLTTFQVWEEPGVQTHPTQSKRLTSALLRLRDYGTQAMYNGRPSCPFCDNFVDDEETHHPSCVLLALVLE